MTVLCQKQLSYVAVNQSYAIKH